MAQTSQKAKLVFREKLTLRSGRLRDAVIWKVPVSDRYPDGEKYRLTLVDPQTGNVLILFDNHFPKGHHRHLKTGEEVPYVFESVEKLVDDYLRAIEGEEDKNKKIQEYYSNGIGAFREGNFAQAILYFKEVIKLDPDHKDAKKYMEMAKIKKFDTRIDSDGSSGNRKKEDAKLPEGF